MTVPATHGPRRVLVISDIVSATQRISFGQPFAEAAEPQVAFQGWLDHEDEIRRRFEAVDPDLLVLSRYTRSHGQVWIDLARRAGAAAIFHLDDDLLAVPQSLGREKYEFYNDPVRLAALRENIEACDLLYASTAPLADTLRRHGIRAPIVAGEVYCSIDPARLARRLPPATGPVIGYMGTSGHGADLALAVPAVERLMDRVPALQFELFGTIQMPPALARFGRRVRHVPAVKDYQGFLDMLQTLGWWVGLAPLEDNAFNRCKADTKWVEYSLAGIATVASDLPVYHRAAGGGAGLLVGDDPAAWLAALEALLLDPALRRATVALAEARLRRSYSHASLRRQVLDVFRRAGQQRAAA